MFFCEVRNNCQMMYEPGGFQGNKLLQPFNKALIPPESEHIKG